MNGDPVSGHGSGSSPVVRAMAAAGAPLIVDGARELARYTAPGALPVHESLAGIPWRDDVRLQSARERWLAAHPTDWNGAKLAFLGVEVVDGHWTGLRLAATDWAEVQSSVDAREADPPMVAERAADAWHLPFTRPSIAVTHAVLVTRDRQVLLCRRAETVRYHPLAWSASFEEGLERADLDGGAGAFERAALRGFTEELGTDSSGMTARCTSLILETAIQNPAVVVLVQADARADELAARFRPSAEETAAEGVRFVPAEPESLAGVIAGHEVLPGLPAGGQPLHPTARYRLLEVLRHLLGNEEAVLLLRGAR